MTKKLISIIAAGTLVLAACGSDSASESSDVQEEVTDTTSVAAEDTAPTPSGVQGEAAVKVIAATKEDGIELDEACVNELTSQLSDEDAQAIVDADGGSAAEISAEGTAIGNQLLGCAGNDQIIDAFIEQMKTSGQEFDEECVRDGLEDIDLAELAASAEGQGGTPEEVVNAVFDCFELGS